MPGRPCDVGYGQDASPLAELVVWAVLGVLGPRVLQTTAGVSLPVVLHGNLNSWTSVWDASASSSRTASVRAAATSDGAALVLVVYLMYWRKWRGATELVDELVDRGKVRGGKLRQTQAASKPAPVLDLPALQAASRVLQEQLVKDSQVVPDLGDMIC